MLSNWKYDEASRLCFILQDLCLLFVNSKFQWIESTTSFTLKHLGDTIANALLKRPKLIGFEVQSSTQGDMILQLLSFEWGIKSREDLVLHKFAGLVKLGSNLGQVDVDIHSPITVHMWSLALSFRLRLNHSRPCFVNRICFS